MKLKFFSQQHKYFMIVFYCIIPVNFKSNVMLFYFWITKTEGDPK